MIKVLSSIFLFFLIFTSCSTEKVNLSPFSDNITNNVYMSDAVGNSAEIITYQSEITNLISTFPKFRNDAVDKEVANLKVNVNGYITSATEQDIKKRKKYYKNFVESYKKIQKLRKYLNTDQDEVLNRYLVRLKTNINLLESLN